MYLLVDQIRFGGISVEVNEQSILNETKHIIWLKKSIDHIIKYFMISIYIYFIFAKIYIYIFLNDFFLK